MVFMNMIPFDSTPACYLEVGDVAGVYDDNGSRVPQTILSIDVDYVDDEGNPAVWVKTEEDPDGQPLDHDDIIPLYIWD